MNFLGGLGKKLKLPLIHVCLCLPGRRFLSLIKGILPDFTVYLTVPALIFQLRYL